MIKKIKRLKELIKKGRYYENLALEIKVYAKNGKYLNTLVKSDIEELILIQDITLTGIRLFTTPGISFYRVTFIPNGLQAIAYKSIEEGKLNAKSDQSQRA